MISQCNTITAALLTQGESVLHYVSYSLHIALDVCAFHSDDISRNLVLVFGMSTDCCDDVIRKVEFRVSRSVKISH